MDYRKEDVNSILETLREGYTIALIDIKALRSKDIIELKRSVAKLKKTIDALEGNLAGFGENVLIATPPFASIYRGEEPSMDMGASNSPPAKAGSADYQGGRNKVQTY